MMKQIKEMIVKTEPGNGINYACFFIAIIVTSILYTYIMFRANLLIVENELENNLHIAESAMLSANQAIVNHETGNREDEFQRELARLMVVSEASYSVDKTPQETEQITKLGNLFTKTLSEQLLLVERDGSGKVHPSNTALKKICGEDSCVWIMSLTIYEPIYKITTYNANAGNHDVMDKETHNIEHVFIDNFIPAYTVDKWVKYELLFNEKNQYLDYIKTPLIEAASLRNEEPMQGATIEGSIGVRMYGLKQIFATDSDSGFFASHQTRTEFSNTKYRLSNGTEVPVVAIWQAVDVVPALDDNRGVNR